jgi:hypothetical protein
VGQLPTGETDLIVRGLAERVRIIRTRVPASVETVAQSLTAPPAAGTWHPWTPRAGGRQSGGTWAVQPRQPALRVLRLGVDPPGRSQVRQYRPPAAGEEPRQSTAKGRARSGRDRAGPVRDADGSQAVGDRVPDRHLQRPDQTPRFPATTPEVSGPPNPDLSAVTPSPAGSGGPLLCLRRNLSGGLR